MATFDRQPFASGNPAVDALFTREFANRQAQRQEDAQAAADATARAQIMAQSQLARAQLEQSAQQAEYNRLFREREFQAKEAGDKVREEQGNKLLKIQEAAYGVGPERDKARRAQAVIDANSNAINDAARANAMFDVEMEKALTKAKGDLHFWNSSAPYNNPNSPEYRALQQKTFAAIRSNLLAEKGGALNNLIIDPNTFKFHPIQYDAEGKAIAAPVPVPAPAPAPGLTANPAALGTSGGLTNAEKAGMVGTVGGSLVSKGLGALADMFKIQAPTTSTANAGASAALPETAPVISTAVPSIRRSYGSTGYLLTPEDDSTLGKLLDETPVAEKSKVYKQMMDFLIQQKRAVPTDSPVGAVTVTAPGPSGVAPANYLDTVLGPGPFRPETSGALFNP